MKIGLPVVVIIYAFVDLFTEFLLLGLLSIQLLSIAGFVVFFVKHKGLSLFKPSLRAYPKAKLKEFLKYSAFNLLGGLGITLAARIDVIMVGFLTDLTHLGIYSIAQNMSTIVNIPLTSLTRILSFTIADSFRNNDIMAIKNIYANSALVSTIVSIFLSLLLATSVQSIFNIMPNGEIYEQGKNVVYIILVALVFSASTGVNTEIISYSKFYHYNLYANILLAGLNIITNYFLIPIFNIEGAAIATLISLVVYNLMKLIVIKIKLNIIPFTFKLLFVLGLGVISFLLCYLIPDVSNAFLNIIINSTLVTISFGLVIYLLKISAEINMYIDQGVSVVTGYFKK